MPKVEQPHFPKWDKRLLGVWKSDRKRTFKEWVWTKKLSPQKKRRFESIFGKLEITFTRGKIIHTLRHQRWEQSRRYLVAATDENGVAIVQYGKLNIKNPRKYDRINLEILESTFPARPEISHLHFDKKHYWISLGNGRNREFFKKIKSGR
jgi:hypothetical protein